MTSETCDLWNIWSEWSEDITTHPSTHPPLLKPPDNRQELGDFYFWLTTSDPRDLWPLRNLIRVMRRRDLIKTSQELRMLFCSFWQREAPPKFEAVFQVKIEVFPLLSKHFFENALWQHVANICSLCWLAAATSLWTKQPSIRHPGILSHRVVYKYTPTDDDDDDALAMMHSCYGSSHYQLW